MSIPSLKSIQFQTKAQEDFCESRQANSKIHWNSNSPSIETAGTKITIIIKSWDWLYQISRLYKGKVTEIVWHWHRDGQMGQWKRMEKQTTNMEILHIILQIPRERESYSISDQFHIHIEKN